MSDTPLTDALTAGCHFGPFVEALADHARRMEKERNEARLVLAECADYYHGMWGDEAGTSWRKQPNERAARWRNAAGIDTANTTGDAALPARNDMKSKTTKAAGKDSLEPLVRPSVKPNGQPTGTFLLSIDDGYVEHIYVIPLRWKAASIDRVYQRIRKALRLREQKGEIRTRHWANAPRERTAVAGTLGGVVGTLNRKDGDA